MSKFIDKLNQLSRSVPQPIGFGMRQAVSPKPKIQLVASLVQESTEQLAEHVVGADAGLLHISKISSGASALQKISQAASDIPWGGQLQGSGRRGTKQVVKAGCDFVVFPAANTPLATFQNDGIGKILEIEASLGEGMLRAVNELPIDAVLIAGEQGDDYSLTWQHLMLFQRFADLLTKPLLASTPSNVTAGELQALWEAGIDGVVMEVTLKQPRDRLKELRQVIDKLPFPVPRRREKTEPLLPHISRETGAVVAEEEEEEEE